MNPKPPKQNQDFEFVAKCQSIATNKCLSFQSLFTQIDPYLFNQILKAYSEKMIFLGETDAEKYLQETLISLSAKRKQQNASERSLMRNDNNPSVQPQPQTMIVVNKQREEEYDQDIDKQWKAARSNFYEHTIKQKLSQNQKLQQHQTQIVKIFMQAQQWAYNQELNIYLRKQKVFHEYKQHIKQMNQSLISINQQFSRRQKETPTIARIIKLKLTSLQIISIQYSLNIDQKHRYSVSAFVLFKVVHKNRGLSSVTLKGVKVQQFKHFIRQMAQQRLNQMIQEHEEQIWMKEFKPSKSLKIAIDTQDNFYSEGNLCELKDLAQFVRLFQQVGEISVKIQPKQYKQYKQYEQLAKQWNALKKLQEQLKMMGNIKLKITIQLYEQYTCDQPFISMLLHMLVSLITVTQLEFRGIRFDQQVSINRLLAMEQILSSIFQNNTVTHLKLKYCQNLPLFPTITKLQTIVLQGVFFRRQFGFMSELAQSSPSLQSITCRYMEQEWKIQEQLFNHLKRLQIQDCQNIGLGMLTHSPSNIKCLAICGSIFLRNVNGLSALFPKLAHITQLSLSSIDFGHQIICTIPSPHLAYLKIEMNNEFENQGLEAIDKKWPKLRYLTLRQCPKLNESGWKVCEFNGLVRLQIDASILNFGHQIRQQFRRRGVREYHYNI